MSMSEDETIYCIVLFKIATGKFHAWLPVGSAKRDVSILLVLAHAVTRPAEAEAHGPAWMYKTREHSL